VIAKQSLERAFGTFTQAADSLQKSYGLLQSEVLRLRFELERTNRDLATSLEANAQMRQYLARVLEALPCGVLVVGGGGELRMANPHARALLSAAEVPTPGDAQIAPEFLRAFLDEFRSGEALNQREWNVETGDGPRTIAMVCAVLGEGIGNGSATDSVLLLHDITEEKRQAAQGEMARRKESLAEMATLLAHEIRNPLGSLELFAGLLADAANNQPNLRRWTDHLQAGLRLLSATVNNVLQFHSQPSLQLTSVNLGRLMRDSVEFLRPLSRQGGLHIDFHNALGELEILADAPRLQQVFFNLSLNAFRAMKVGGMLSVRLLWSDHDTFQTVRIDFEDTGRGIPADQIERIFEPGFTSQSGNPGLGLAVCRAVIEQHRGKIAVASEPGAGTTFSLILPREGEAL
jgi:signal transduction histidine kinase